MPKRRSPIAITAVWETLPDADPKAVDKAFLMLFRPESRRRTVATIMPEIAELDKTP